jgi:voltage-gated potassium channel
MPDRPGEDHRVPAADARAYQAAGVTFLLVVLATVIYFLLPVPHRMRESSWGVIFAIGVIVLGLLMVLLIRRLLHADIDARARSLIVLLTCVVLFFSWANVTLSRIPGEFADLHTKIDSLYYSVSTLATVGFGDVHATGQLARAAVTLQILFNLVFLGTGITMVTGLWRRQVQARREHRGLEH